MGLLGAPQQQIKKSKVTVYDLQKKSTKVIYEADALIEAPNWSPDGKYLLVNTGGALYAFLSAIPPRPSCSRLI